MDDTANGKTNLEIKSSRLSTEIKEEPKETYKKLNEDDHTTIDNPIKSLKVANMVRENGENLADGAEEKMLTPEEKNVEVKFISSASANEQNGDAKIDIGKIEKSFSGMTKDELMRYANDPFWVRLRWILFILFWALWLGMLIGAILIIISAPKCDKPVPLKWFEKGPLIIQEPHIDSSLVLESEEIKNIEKFGAKGVIYTLDGDKTYAIDSNEEEAIRKIVAAYAEHDIKVILDITPNYVLDTHPAFEEAKTNATKRAPFVFVDGVSEPKDWFKPGLDNNKSAWEKMNSVSILKQFGSNRVDLRLDSDEGKVMLKEALAKFLDIGVLGFRLANVKHFIISRDLKSETIDRSGKGTNATIGDYNFYTHSQSTFGAGLGDLLKEFAAYVHEKSNDEAFLSVKDQIPDLEVEKFQVKENFLFDLPLYGSIENLLIDETAADVILHKLNRTRNMVGKQQIQLPYTSISGYQPEDSNIFMMLLPGVPVVSRVTLDANEAMTKLIQDLEKLRETESYMHGDFNLYLDANKTVLGYTRHKSGNPGYFVVLNPTKMPALANFEGVKELPVELKLLHKGDKFETSSSPIKTNGINMPPRTAIVLSYVQRSDD